MKQLDSHKQHIELSLNSKICALREEFDQTSLDLKKLKAEKYDIWPCKRHKNHFNFNEETVDSLNRILVAIQSEHLEDAESLVTSEWDRYHRRNKLSKIADSSE